MVKREDPRKKQRWVYALTLLFSMLFLVVGREIAMNGYPDFGEPDTVSYRAKVLEVEPAEAIDGGVQRFCQVRMLNGPQRDQVVTVRQAIYEVYQNLQEPVEVGDRILVYDDIYYEGNDWLMLEYIRSDGVLILAGIFCALVLLFGRFKGLNTLISLGFTCLAVFAVFLPAVLSGKNIYFWSIIVCLFMILMTMLLINGASKKSFAAGFGCFSGVVVAGVLSFLMNNGLKMTGMLDDETLYLTMVNTSNAIDLKGVIFAAVIIGATGAIMDVAMDIASSLNEIRTHNPRITGPQLIRSGLNIGRDVMGTMANTLVLAYIGSSLCTTLLLVVYNVSMDELMNMELIVSELLQALVGSFGILLAIPLTSLICAVIYPRHGAEEAVVPDLYGTGERQLPPAM